MWGNLIAVELLKSRKAGKVPGPPQRLIKNLE